MSQCEAPPYGVRRCHKHPGSHGGQCKCFAGWAGEFCEVKAESYCVGGCSGKGSCVQGVCHCEPPFFGVNCALFRTPQGVQRLMHPCAPLCLSHGTRNSGCSFVRDLEQAARARAGNPPSHGGMTVTRSCVKRCSDVCTCFTGTRHQSGPTCLACTYTNCRPSSTRCWRTTRTVTSQTSAKCCRQRWAHPGERRNVPASERPVTKGGQL
jgi:hypothetical protein